MIAKYIYTDVAETLAKGFPSFATVNWWMAKFKRCRKRPENNPNPREDLSILQSQ
jgi:hypothetical protein